jgi:hypothetical protein
MQDQAFVQAGFERLAARGKPGMLLQQLACALNPLMGFLGAGRPEMSLRQGVEQGQFKAGVYGVLSGGLGRMGQGDKVFLVDGRGLHAGQLGQRRQDIAEKGGRDFAAVQAV